MRRSSPSISRMRQALAGAVGESSIRLDEAGRCQGRRKSRDWKASTRRDLPTPTRKSSNTRAELVDAAYGSGLLKTGKTVTAKTASSSPPAARPNAACGASWSRALHLLQRGFRSSEELPKSIVIAGGGYIAVEFANIFHGLGVETTLIYRGDGNPVALRPGYAAGAACGDGRRRAFASCASDSLQIDRRRASRRQTGC